MIFLYIGKHIGKRDKPSHHSYHNINKERNNSFVLDVKYIYPILYKIIYHKRKPNQYGKSLFMLCMLFHNL